MASQLLEIGSEMGPAARMPEVDFAVVLSRVISSMNGDPAQLRNAVYELARIKLQREAWQRDPPLNLLEMRRMMMALDCAIEHVETIHAKHDDLRALRSLDRLIANSEFAARETIIERHEPLLITGEPTATSDIDHSPRRAPRVKPARASTAQGQRWRGTGPLVRGAMVAMLGLALCVVLDRQFGLFGRQQSRPPVLLAQNHERPEPKSAAQAPASAPLLTTVTGESQLASALPLPTVYGVYALSGGELHELEPLPGRVPDPRVMISTPINTPSRNVLPDGRIAFVVYRRDIASSAPDRLTVRVIAKITRTMKFANAGAANVASVQDSWAIRNVSYDFRVAPLSESSEMLMVRPENNEFVLPAGRYGLVLKGQAYDFTVAGSVTNDAHCLERVEAANGEFYSACRRK